MSAPPGFLEGYKAIAKAIGRSERSCKRYARRRRDPLPVYLFLGAIVIRETALKEWMNRQGIAPGMQPVE